MKLIIPILLFSLNIHAKCVTDAVVYKHETGFGISFGGGGGKSSYNDSMSINVPLSINGEDACFRKKSSFNIKTEEKKDSTIGKLVISPASVEFENVPEAKVKHYIFADKSNDPFQTKFYSMSFVCSGEIPLSIDATSDSYLEVDRKTKDASISVTTVFATGAAAENLKKGKVNNKAEEAFKFFSAKYQLDNDKKADVVCCNQKVPSILTMTSVESLTGVERAIASSFTTLGSQIPNGCSKSFEDKMKNYLIENYKSNESLEPFDVSKKWFKDVIVLEWKNKK
jgi:hypothetical protein